MHSASYTDHPLSLTAWKAGRQASRQEERQAGRPGKASQAMQGQARPRKARPGKARPGKGRQRKARQGKARQVKASQGKARQGRADTGARAHARQHKCVRTPT